MKQCRHRVGGRTCIDHKQNRHIQQRRNLSTAAAHAVIAVKQSHHALNHSHIGTGRITCKNLTYMLRRSHPGIQIDRLPPGCYSMELRVNIIRTALERLDIEPTPRKSPQQSHSKRGLAAA